VNAKKRGEKRLIKTLADTMLAIHKKSRKIKIDNKLCLWTGGWIWWDKGEAHLPPWKKIL